MLEVTPKAPRVNKSFRLKADVIDIIAELAELYNTSEVSILEAVFAQYGPKLIEQRKKEITQ